MADYDQSVAPREGRSAISPQTRQRIWGNPPQQQFGYGYGGNQNVPAGAYGGTQDYGGGGGGFNNYDLGRMFQQLLAQYQPQESPSSILTTRSYLRDPVGFRAKEKDVASMGPTFDEAFKGRMAADTMTPEAIMASQGNTAANQWAQLGGNKNINQDELRRLNAAATAGRGFRSYM